MTPGNFRHSRASYQPDTVLRQLTAAVALVISSAGSALAQADPASLPVRDAHEGVLVAANPYQDAARYKTRFGKKNPYDAGILAIEVFFRNDNDKPILVELESIRLLLRPPEGDRQRLSPLAVEDVVDRILNKGGPDPSATRRPIPMPGRGPKTGRSKQWVELEKDLRAAAFEMTLLPPRSTTHGFFFFDINHRYDLLRFARLVVSDLSYIHNKQALLYFELDLSAALPR